MASAEITVNVTETEVFKDLIAYTKRLEAYACALERNGVAAGTVKYLRAQYLEDGDLETVMPDGT